MIDNFALDGPYGFLSNFYVCQVELDGHSYCSLEHAYQAAKTLDMNERTKIRAAATPGQAKKLGQEVTLRSDWEQIKIQVMEGLLLKKFSHPHLMLSLLGTGDEQLVEGNWWGDTFWGVCRGRGQNHLGKLLMKVRAALREDGGPVKWARPSK